ncbi:MAG: DUF1211 domain-containing protein [Bacteroidetes bacterium]|nr:DUF1211 domain-containing protein [Fibrella sp.]
MKKNRLEAFSDGVIAIIITIMVLEMKIPPGDSLNALRPLIPVFISYILSYIYVGIYWNNHHHLWQLVDRVDGKVLWANLHLLFWLSLFPFTTGWMGKNHFATWPTALYGFVVLMAALAWNILSRSLVRLHGENSNLANTLRQTTKEKISTLIYTLALVVCFVNTWISFALYTLVALIWFVPDRRIENQLRS